MSTSSTTRNPRPSVQEQSTNWIDRLADYITGPVLNVFGFGVRLMGPFFVVGFYLLLALHVYAYFTVILTVLKKRLGVEFGIVWVAIGLIIVYNIAYNHFFATIIKPGGPSDLKNIEQVRKELKQREAKKQIGHEVQDNDGNIKYVEDDRFEGMTKEVKGLLKYRNKTITQLEQSWKKKCKQCNYIKPIRAHHCSVCNRCVFLMDHHCPWVNNCLGLENLRYFLLFIFYLMIGTIYNLVTIMAIWNHRIYKQNGSMMSFIAILDFALTVVLLGFNGWNWYLAMSGFSTIEFFGTVSRADSGEKYDFNFGSIRDNLYKTFGTQNLFAIFSPSLRNVPFSGIEWSYQMRDLGFNEKGEQMQRLIEDEEEKMETQPVVDLEEIELTEISYSTNKKRVTNDSTLDFLDNEIEI